MQELNWSGWIRYLSNMLSILEGQIRSECLTKRLTTLDTIAQSLLLIYDKQSLILKASSVKGFIKLSLSLVKTSLLLIEAFKLRLTYQPLSKDKEQICQTIASLQGSTFNFMMKYLEKDLFNIQKTSTIDFKEEIELIEDVSYLIEMSQFD